MNARLNLKGRRSHSVLVLLSLSIASAGTAATHHIENQVYKLSSDQRLIVDFLAEGAGAASTLGWFYFDLDTDGDGIPNFYETGPADDLDGDTIPNSSDPDDDGDGIPDTTDNAAGSGLAGSLMPASAFQNGTAAAAAGTHAGDYMQWVPTNVSGSYYADPSVNIYIDTNGNEIPDAMEYATGSHVIPPMALPDEFNTTHIVEGAGYTGLLGVDPVSGYSGDVIFKLMEDDTGTFQVSQWNTYSPYAGTTSDSSSTTNGQVDYLIYGTTDPASSAIPFALKNPDGTIATDGDSQQIFRYRYVGPKVSSQREIVFFQNVYYGSGGSNVNTYYSRTEMNPDSPPSDPTYNGVTSGDDYGETVGGVSNNWFPRSQDTANHNSLANAFSNGSITTWTALATAPTDGSSPIAVVPGNQSWVDLWENWRADRRIVQYMGLGNWLDLSAVDAEQLVLDRYAIDINTSTDNILVRSYSDRSPHMVLVDPSGTTGITLLGMEDIFGGGDRDFEDIIVAIRSGAVSVDELVTTDSTPTLTGNADTASVSSLSVTVYDSTGANVASGPTSYSSGAWSYIVASPLADGLYNVHAVANTGQTDFIPTDLVIDSTAPATTAPSDAGVYTNNSTVTFNWTAPTDATTSVATVTLQVGTSPGANDVFDGDVLGTTSKAIAGTHGTTYYARLQASDALGNSTTSGNSNGITVDTVLPVATAPTDAGTITSSSSVAFNWSAPTDAHSGVASTTLQVGTTPGGNDVFDGDVTGNTSQNVTGATGQTLYARLIVTDNAGNSTTTGNSDGILVDTTDPVASTPTDSGIYTNSTTVAINWSAPSDAHSGVASTTLQVGTTPGGNDVFDGDVTGNTSQNVAGATGQTLYARLIVADNAGNSTTTGNSDGILVDTTDPVASTPTDSGAYTNSTTVAINWSAPSDAHSGVASTTLQVGTTPGGNDIFDGDVTGNTSQNVTGASGQSLYARLVVVDNAGNSTTTGNSDGILVDTDLPVSSASVADVTQVSGDIVGGTYTADDGAGSAVDSVALYVKEPSGSWTNTGTISGGVWTYTPGAGNGEYQFASVATDNAANSEAAPTGSDPGDITVIYNTATNGIYSLPTISDGVYTFPMTDDLDVVITFSGGASGGPVAVSRTTGDTSPAGLDAARLIDESLTITGVFTGEASILWNFDPTSDDGITGTVDTVFQFETGTLANQYNVSPSGDSITIPGVTTFSDWWAGDNSADVPDWELLED